MFFATSSFRSRVLAMPIGSIVSATSAAPCFLANGTTRSIRSRPFSMLMELMTARPGIASRARSMTGASVESIMMGVSTVIVGTLGHGDTDVEQVRARLDLLARDVRDSLVVVGEEQALDLARALRVDALTDEQRLGILIEVRGAHGR